MRYALGLDFDKHLNDFGRFDSFTHIVDAVWWIPVLFQVEELGDNKYRIRRVGWVWVTDPEEAKEENVFSDWEVKTYEELVQENIYLPTDEEWAQVVEAERAIDREIKSDPKYWYSSSYELEMLQLKAKWLYIGFQEKLADEAKRLGLE